MRAIECPCGHRLEGADDDEFLRLARARVDPDDLRERVAADAHDVERVA